jgi:hypothetical protein
MVNNFDIDGFISIIALGIGQQEYSALSMETFELDEDTNEIRYTDSFVMRKEQIEKELHEISDKFKK